MDIVACTDKWFAMPTGVMMYSVCVNNPDVDIAFHIIVDGSVTSKEQKDLEETIAPFGGKTLVFYDVDVTKFPSFPNIKAGTGVTQAAYYRLMLSEILPKDIHKVLYLDGDIIVRHSLLPLWNTDLKEHPVGVVTDGLEGNLELYHWLNYPPQLGYFNSGVMLVNLEYWREQEVTGTFMCYLQEHADSIKYWDQDVLNVVFSNNKVVLPIKYNLTSGFLWKLPQYNYNKYEKEVLEARKDPVIVHFAGFKPWKAYYREPKHPFLSTFHHYQNQTKWKGMKIDKRSVKLRIINFIADVLRKYGLKSQITPTGNDYIDIAPID